MPAGYDTYLYHRAEMELMRARKAACPEAARVHQELADRYLARFYRPETAPDPEALGDGPRRPT